MAVVCDGVPTGRMRPRSLEVKSREASQKIFLVTQTVKGGEYRTAYGQWYFFALVSFD